MANRSDRRFQTLSPRMAARGRQTDQQNEARGNPSRPGLHLTPDKQAGYMTATEFQIASAIQPLHAGGVHICVAERGEFELPVPISEQSDYKKMAGFAVPRGIVGIARGSNAGSAYTIGNVIFQAPVGRGLYLSGPPAVKVKITPIERGYSDGSAPEPMHDGRLQPMD